MNSFNPMHSDSFSDSMKDPRKLKGFLSKNKKDIAQWGILVLCILFVFWYFSSGDFSFTLTLSSLIQTFGFILLVFKVINCHSISGLSRNTLICYSICLLSRLSSILSFEGYLPYDETGDFVYRISEILTFICCLLLLFFSFVSYKDTYSWELDTFKWYYFAIPAAIFSYLVHPSLNNVEFADAAWTFALYLETVAMLPQLDVFRKKGGEIESYTSHYVASQSISRIVQFVFWVFSYHELNEPSKQSYLPEYVGYFILVVQIIQIALTGDFLYFYITSIKRGIPLTLPSYVI